MLAEIFPLYAGIRCEFLIKVRPAWIWEIDLVAFGLN